MRPDMIPGVTFPDYELSDHTGKHRKLSELQAGDPMVLVLGRGGFCPKDRRQAEGLLQLHREMEVGYCRMLTSRPTISSRPVNIAAASERTGPSSRIRGASFRKISTSPNTPTPSIIR